MFKLFRRSKTATPNYARTPLAELLAVANASGDPLADELARRLEAASEKVFQLLKREIEAATKEVTAKLSAQLREQNKPPANVKPFVPRNGGSAS